MSVLKDDNKNKIPVFRTWKQWYAFVIVILVLMIVLFYLLTQHFA